MTISIIDWTEQLHRLPKKLQTNFGITLKRIKKKYGNIFAIVNITGSKENVKEFMTSIHYLIPEYDKQFYPEIFDNVLD